MIIVENENYRLASIYTIPAGEQPTSKGLAVERRCVNGQNWYVICFVKWDPNESSWYIDCVGNRLLDIESDKWNLVKSMIQDAGDLVRVANKY